MPKLGALIAFALAVVAAILVVAVLAVMVQEMNKVKTGMCSGPGSGVNSDVCADVQEEWSP